MTSAKPTRIVGIQVCRGIAALLVVLSHLHNVEVKYCTTQNMRVFQYGVLGVDLFFVISGVVIGLVTFDKFGKPFSGRIFLYQRLVRIFPVYWIYSALALIAYLHSPQLFNSTSGHQEHIVMSFLLLPSTTPMLVRQGWTLSYEVYFYATIGILLCFVSRRSAGWSVFAWGAVIMAIGLSGHVSGAPIMQMFESPMVLEFVAGLMIFYIFRKAWLWKVVGILSFVLSIIWLAGVIDYNAGVLDWHANAIISSGWMRIGLYGPFAALLVLAAVEIERNTQIRYPVFLQKLGDWSYSIYLSHLIIIEVISRAITRYTPQSPYRIFLIDTLSIPVVLFVGYLSFRFIERPMTQYLYQWSSLVTRWPAGKLVQQAAD